MAEDEKTAAGDPQQAEVKSLLAQEGAAGDLEGGEKSLLSEPAKSASEKYDLKVPEGSRLDAAHVDEIASYAKEQGLSNEQAQRLLEREHSLVERSSEKFSEEQNRLVEQYNADLVKSVKADPEIGGDKLTESAEKARRAFKELASEKLFERLSNPMFGNDPEIIRLGYHIYERFMSEGRLELGGQAIKKKQLTAEEIMYPRKEP